METEVKDNEKTFLEAAAGLGYPRKDCDDWLTDDNELEALEDLTKDCIIYNKQL